MVDRARPRNVPYSRLRARWHVGPLYFTDRGLVAVASRGDVGLVEDLEDFRYDSFDSRAVHDAVRAFYEHTSDFQLDSIAAPPRWSRWVLRAFGRFARSVGQTDFPIGVDAADCRMTSTIEPLRGDAVPGAQPRCWVRTWDHAGMTRTLYAAAYTSHDHDGIRYLDIAFPFPGGTLASTLRFEQSPNGGTNLTTSNAARASRRDAGIRWLGRRATFRLPMSETIRVWPADADDLPNAIAGTHASVVAQHHIRLLGIRFLTLYYIARRPT